VFVGGHPGVGEREPAPVGAQDETDAPDPFALGGAEAVGGCPRELALGSAAGEVGDPDQGAVREPGAAHVQEPSELLLHNAKQPCQRAWAPVVLRLRGQMREPARQPVATKTEELAVRAEPHRRLTNSQSDQLRVSDLRCRPRPRRDRIVIGEHIRRNDKGFQVRRHLELLSRGDTLWKPFVIETRVPT
jgi:hypothetical protein